MVKIFIRCFIATAIAASLATVANVLIARPEMSIANLGKSAVIFFVVMFAFEWIRTRYRGGSR